MSRPITWCCEHESQARRSVRRRLRNCAAQRSTYRPVLLPKARAALPSLPSPKALSASDVFEGLGLQRIRLHHDQQIPECGKRIPNRDHETNKLKPLVIASFSALPKQGYRVVAVIALEDVRATGSGFARWPCKIG
jgi:hypothetical protein